MKKQTLFSLLLCLLLLCSCVTMAVPVQASSDASDVIAKAKQGVVQVYSYAVFPQGGAYYYTGAVGSGFAVGKKNQDSNVFVTNRHVITMDEEFDPSQVRIWLLFDGCTFDDNGIPNPNRSMECDLVTISGDYPDYAIIRTKSNVEGFKSLPLRPSDDCADGSSVYALGYPAVVREVSASKFGKDDITVTDGIVSKHMALPSKGNSKAILHTAQISGGNSGGPLIDKDGAVVGLNTYGFGEEIADRSVAIYSDYIIDALKAHDLPYYTPGSFNTMWLFIGGGAAIAVIVLAVLLNKKKQPAPIGGGSIGLSGGSIPTQPVTYRLRCSDGTSYNITGTTTTIGRESGCQIRLPESAVKVSRRHCTLELTATGLILTDIGSSNGTFIHGKRVPTNTRIALKEGSQFSLGSSDITFTVSR